jgi:hypothetical protein
MNFLEQCYNDLQKLEYSEENIAELFSIANKIISFLESKDSNRKTNSALHYVLLTKEKEFGYFEEKNHEDLQNNFREAKRNLMSDLLHNCKDYWDPQIISKV